MQTSLGVGQLAFVNDESGFVPALKHLGNDLVEGHDFDFDSGRKEPQGQISSREFSRYSDPLFLDLTLRECASGDDHRPVAVANAAAARQQCVMILNVGKGVERDGSYVVDAFLRLAVQRLDVTQRVGEAQPGHANFVRGQAVEHECIVGVGAVRNCDLTNLTIAGGMEAGLFRGAGWRHACTLGARRRRTATAAATRTLITSANTNQYSPNCTARFIEPVQMASQPRPLAKSNTSASKPETAALANVLRPRSI